MEIGTILYFQTYKYVFKLFVRRPLDEHECTGCRACIEACPYGAIGFDEMKAVAQKCNLCHHRVGKGLLPACADNVCLAHCIQFHPS